MPRATNFHPRHELMHWLDQALDHVLIWVAAPAGYGKTVLVASYFASRPSPVLWYRIDDRDGDPAAFFNLLYHGVRDQAAKDEALLPRFTVEAYANLERFARDFFEAMWQLLPAPACLVLDNYQDLPDDSPVAQLLRILIRHTPDGNHLFIIGRELPTPEFVVAKPGAVAVLTEAELRLTGTDLAAIAALRGHTLPPPNVEELLERSQGWLAAAILLLQRRHHRLPAMPWDTDGGRALVFAYLANEVFDALSAEEQKAFLLVAFVPYFNEQVLELIGAPPEAMRVFCRFADAGSFVYRRQTEVATYELHPLVRDFLRNRLTDSVKPERVAEIKLTAAMALAEIGEVECAVELLRALQRWKELTAIVIRAAPDFLSQGRHRFISDLIGRLPEGLAMANPWLAYWQATALLPLAPAVAYETYRQSYGHFQKQEDLIGVVRSWCGAVDAIVNVLSDLKRLDFWLTELDHLESTYASDLDDGLRTQLAPRVFAALAIRRPDREDLNSRKERVLAMLDEPIEPSLKMASAFYLSTYATWMGEQALQGSLIERQRSIDAAAAVANPLSRLMTQLARTWYAWSEGQYEETFGLLEEGLTLAKQVGIEVWNPILLNQGAIAALSVGDIERADGYLEKMVPFLERARTLDVIYYYHQRGWQAFLQGEMARSRHCQDQAHRYAKDLGGPFIELETGAALAQICFSQGEYGEAEVRLEEARAIAHRTKSHAASTMCDFIAAHHALCQQRYTDTELHLSCAFERIAKQGFVGYSWWRRDIAAALCEYAIDHGIETKLAHKLIERFGILPGPDERYGDIWAWPIKVYTLGEFRLIKAGRDLPTAGEGRSRPVDLLKVLLAYGGRKVRESKIADALWPDADGDAAHRSFATTLHRLRKLLGPETLVVKRGHLSLNAKLCWVDKWEFEQLASEVIGHPPGPSGAGEERIIRRALALYQGSFLAADQTQPWLLPAQTKLNNLWVGLVKQLIVGAREGGDWQQCVALYERALSLDEGNEEHYRGLMECHMARGRSDEAIAVYQRCRAVLVEQYGREPSSETEQLRKHLPR